MSYKDKLIPSDCEYISGSARFADGARTVITFNYRKKKRFINDPVDEKIQVYNLSADPDDKRFKYLISNFEDLDNIHLNTYRIAKEQRRKFEELILFLAKREGLLFDMGLGDSKSYKNFLFQIFQETSPTSNEDVNNLFSIKLDIFEIPHIRQSTNSELKRALRRAQTPLEVVKAAIDIQLDNLENGIEIQVKDNDSTNLTDTDVDVSD